MQYYCCVIPFSVVMLIVTALVLLILLQANWKLAQSYIFKIFWWFLLNECRIQVTCCSALSACSLMLKLFRWICVFNLFRLFWWCYLIISDWIWQRRLDECNQICGFGIESMQQTIGGCILTTRSAACHQCLWQTLSPCNNCSPRQYW